MTIKTFDFVIISMDLCVTSQIVVCMDYAYIHVLNLFSLKVIKKVQIGYLYAHIKIINECSYCIGINPNFKIFNLKKFVLRQKSQERGYFPSSLWISVSRGLIAYGYDQLYLYNMKLQTGTANRYLGMFNASISFVQCYILCASMSGGLFYLDSYGLAIKICFQLNIKEIHFISSSNDLNFIVYSNGIKSFVLDFNSKRIIFGFDLRIISGIFMEKKTFAFLSDVKQFLF